MNFWDTNESSVWQGESLSTELHNSLFKSAKSHEVRKKSNLQKGKKKKKKGNKEDSHEVETKLEDVEQTLSKEMETDPSEKQSDRVSKRKRKRMKRTVDLEAGNDAGNADRPLTSKRTVLSQTSIPSSSTDGNAKPGQNTLNVSNELGEQNEAQQEDRTVAPPQKKRKRKPKKNKFKTYESSSEGEEDKNTNISSRINGTVRMVDSDDGSGETDVKLSRKERRKLKRKMLKEQHASVKKEESEPAQKKIKKKKANDGSVSSQNVPDKNKKLLPNKDDEIKDEGFLDESEEVPQDETKSDLILVKSKKTKTAKSGQSLKTQMESQLKSSQFRFLNEQLYKVSGQKASDMFAEDGSAFLMYHEGFTQQVEQWPLNPVDIMIDALKKRPASHLVGDFGCGDAKIAQSVRQKVHSFDLYAINKHVTVCDVSQVPLRDGVLDVAVFCLSLMGTNWMEYVMEANRVLKNGGLLKIAEVASRFTSLPAFLSAMKALGFQLKTKDLSNKMFYLFDFKKKSSAESLPTVKSIILKPCLYKKR